MPGNQALHIGIREARAKIGELVDQVRYTGNVVVLEKSGTPAAALVPLEMAERYMRERAEMFARIARIQATADASDIDDADLLQWVNNVVHEARAAQAEIEDSGTTE